MDNYLLSSDESGGKKYQFLYAFSLNPFVDQNNFHIFQIKMKLNELLQEEIKRKLEPRKPIFITRVKMLIQLPSNQWSENCRGLLILYVLDGVYYFAIMNIVRFQISFDMQIYTNFLSYSKFSGETKSVLFPVPLKQKIVKFLFVLESKQQLIEFKNRIQSFQFREEPSQQMTFFGRPQVSEILKLAQIDEQFLDNKRRFRGEVEEQIKLYLQQVERAEVKKKNTGFKAYGFGKQEWKLAKEEVEYMKEKRKSELIEHLGRLYRQAKIS